MKKMSYIILISNMHSMSGVLDYITGSRFKLRSIKTLWVKLQHGTKQDNRSNCACAEYLVCNNVSMFYSFTVLCYSFFIFRIWSFVGAEENTVIITQLLNINEAFTVKYRRNTTGAILLLNHLGISHNKREFISFHCEYLFICLRITIFYYYSFVSPLFLGVKTTGF